MLLELYFIPNGDDAFAVTGEGRFSTQATPQINGRQGLSKR